MSSYRAARARRPRTTSTSSFSPSSRFPTASAPPTTLFSPDKRYHRDEDNTESATSDSDSDRGRSGEKTRGSGSSSASEGESNASGEQMVQRQRRGVKTGQSTFTVIIAVLAFLLLVAIGVAIYLRLQSESSRELEDSAYPGTGGSAASTGSRTRTTDSVSSARSRPTEATDESATRDTSKPTSHSETDESTAEEPAATNNASDTINDMTSDSPPTAETKTEEEAHATATSSPSSDNPFIDSCLKAHNDFRASHHADPLEWDEELASFAANWLEGCSFEHSGGPYGENLAGNGPFDPKSQYDAAGGILGWTNEEKDYTYNPSSGFSMGTGHFTQVVWKDSKLLGCAYKACPGFLSGDGQYGAIMACEYKPAGNMAGAYEQNVQAP